MENGVEMPPSEEGVPEIDETRVCLDNWVKLSPPVKGAEKARGMVANALKTDLTTNPDSLSLIAGEVKRMTQSNIGYLDNRIKVSPQPIRTMHDEDPTVFTEVEKTQTGWVAREVRETNGQRSIISEAGVGTDGSTSLILNYTDENHVSQNANPGINGERYPRAAATTFNLLVNSVKPPSLVDRIASRIHIK